jgi:hypothetical protein
MTAQDRASGTAIAELKTLFRVVNEEIEGVHESLGADRPEFLCECGRDECCARISMSIEEYERVRSVPTRFAVAPGHEWPGFESVVEANARFAVVETEAEEVTQMSIARDPRRRGRPMRRARPSLVLAVG